MKIINVTGFVFYWCDKTKRLSTNSLMAVSIMVLLSSCMTHQYVTLSSNLKENDQKEFIFENDTLMIKYNFNGENCPARIYFENKLFKPLYVDWSRSAIIENDESRPFWQDQAFFQGTARNITSPGYFQQYGTATFNGTIIQNESTTFLPPKSFRQTEVVSLQNNLISTPKPRRHYTQNILTPLGDIKVFYYEYEKSKSPKRYRSYLTLSDDPSLQTSFVYEHEFWISEVMQTSNGSQELTVKDGNQYTLSKTTGFGKFLGVTVVLALVLILAAGN